MQKLDELRRWKKQQVKGRKQQLLPQPTFEEFMRSTNRSALKRQASPVRRSQDSSKKNPVMFELGVSPYDQAEHKQQRILSPPSTTRSHNADAEYFQRSININLKKSYKTSNHKDRRKPASIGYFQQQERLSSQHAPKRKYLQEPEEGHRSLKSSASRARKNNNESIIPIFESDNFDLAVGDFEQRIFSHQQDGRASHLQQSSSAKRHTGTNQSRDDLLDIIAQDKKILTCTSQFKTNLKNIKIGKSSMFQKNKSGLSFYNRGLKQAKNINKSQKELLVRRPRESSLFNPTVTSKQKTVESRFLTKEGLKRNLSTTNQKEKPISSADLDRSVRKQREAKIKNQRRVYMVSEGPHTNRSIEIEDQQQSLMNQSSRENVHAASVSPVMSN